MSTRHNSVLHASMVDLDGVFGDKGVDEIIVALGSDDNLREGVLGVGKQFISFSMRDNLGDKFDIASMPLLYIID